MTNNKQFNEIYRDFYGLAKSKTLSEIANWLDDHEEFEMIKRDDISITFTFEKCDLIVCITKGSVNIKNIYDILLYDDIL